MYDLRLTYSFAIAMRLWRLDDPKLLACKRRDPGGQFGLGRRCLMFLTAGGKRIWDLAVGMSRVRRLPDHFTF
jgi:hypothetical protein